MQGKLDLEPQCTSVLGDNAEVQHYKQATIDVTIVQGVWHMNDST
jgi:hypothetical protein